MLPRSTKNWYGYIVDIFRDCLAATPGKGYVAVLGSVANGLTPDHRRATGDTPAEAEAALVKKLQDALSREPLPLGRHTHDCWFCANCQEVIPDEQARRDHRRGKHGMTA